MGGLGIALALACLFALVAALFGCSPSALPTAPEETGSASRADGTAPEAQAQALADPDHPTLSPSELESLTADETVAWAKEIAELTTTRMLDFEPFYGQRCALLEDSANTREALIAGSYSGEDAVMPIKATSAFYPFTATAVEAYYAKEANEAAPAPLEPIATTEAFAALAQGQDIVYVSSRPNDEQQAALEASGRDIRCEVIAYEALIFYSRDSTLAEGRCPSLSSEDIRSCFTSDNPTYTGFALEHGNGSTRCFEEFLSGHSASLDISEAVMVYPDMNSIIAGAALSDASIGYAFHQFYHRNCSSSLLKLVAVDGVYPSWEAIRTGAYPVMCEVCVLFDGEGEHAAEAEAYVNWMRSDAGKQVILDVGLCPYG